MLTHSRREHAIMWLKPAKTSLCHIVVERKRFLQDILKRMIYIVCDMDPQET